MITTYASNAGKGRQPKRSKHALPAYNDWRESSNNISWGRFFILFVPDGEMWQRKQRHVLINYHLSPSLSATPTLWWAARVSPNCRYKTKYTAPNASVYILPWLYSRALHSNPHPYETPLHSLTHSLVRCRREKFRFRERNGARIHWWEEVSTRRDPCKLGVLRAYRNIKRVSKMKRWAMMLYNAHMALQDGD